MPSEKKRVSYDKEMRAQAKAEGAGLITFAITFPNGESEEYQLVGHADACRFARWAGAALQQLPGVLPDLETVVRRHLADVEEQQ